LRAPVKGSRAGFDNHCTPVDLCKDLQKLIAHDPVLENDAAIAVAFLFCIEIIGPHPLDLCRSRCFIAIIAVTGFMLWRVVVPSP
jgi:hypothetical protein